MNCLEGSTRCWTGVLRREATWLTVALAFLLIGAVSSASAAGGSSIASAPTVVYGQQEVGNTAADYGSQTRTGDLNGDSWWRLQATAGDRITIDWEGNADELNVWPAGTTDYNIEANSDDGVSSNFVSAYNGANLKMETVLTVPRDGSYPLEFLTDYPFCGCGVDPGPYDFTAYVQHALVIASTATRSNRRQHRTSFWFSVANPDGAAITDPNLRFVDQIWNGRKWVNGPVSAAPFAFSVRWNQGARGRWQRVRIVVFGQGYISTASRTVRVPGI
jgi:hypothetical protein